jgi:chemotaxis signal transduction protein
MLALNFTATAVGTDSSQILVFSLRDENSAKRMDYGVEVGQVQEIGLLENISRVPNAPAYVKGVMNLRGKIITIVDVKEKLGFQAIKEVNASTRILIVGVGSTLMGLLVDEIDEVVRILASEIEPNPTSIAENTMIARASAPPNSPACRERTLQRSRGPQKALPPQRQEYKSQRNRTRRRGSQRRSRAGRQSLSFLCRLPRLLQTCPRPCKHVPALYCTTALRNSWNAS